MDKPLAGFWSDPSRIWHRSPLTREATHRVLNAPGLIVVDGSPEIEAASLALALLVDMSMGIALEQPRAARSAKRAAANAYLDFMNKVSPLWFTFDGPPPIPAEWFEEMANWARTQLTAPADKGAPVDTFDHFFYPWILGFYRRVFEREPSSSVGGPTERFLSAIYTEMEIYLAEAEFTPPEAGLRARRAWQRPTEAATLRRKVRDFRAASLDRSKLVDAMLSIFFRRVTEDPEPTKH